MKPTRKILVVATTKWTKKQEAAAIKEARAIMMAGDAFADVVIDIDYRKFGKPETYLDAKGQRRITHDWFEEHISTYAKAMGYDTSRFRISLAEGRRWGLASNVRGTDFTDDPDDRHGEGWIQCNPTTKIKFVDGSTRLAFPKILAHEEGHTLNKLGLTNLDIHNFDYQTLINNIEGFYKQLVLLDTKPPVTDNYYSSMLNWLNKIKEEIFNRPIYPIPRKLFMDKPTQHWLVANSLYDSGYHNGLDVEVPNGQPIVAPHNGTIYLTGLSKELGNYCFFECTLDGQKLYSLFPHLSSEPRLGQYAKGQVIGRVGNTGLSTNPHLHWTLLRVKPESVSEYVSMVNTKERIIKNTIDPYIFMMYAVDRIKL